MAWEPLYDSAKIDDELAAFIVRLGAGMSTPGLDPAAGGGCYLFVANGGIEMAGEALPKWSMVYVDPEEPLYAITAGPLGAEVVVMQFPKHAE